MGLPLSTRLFIVRRMVGCTENHDIVRESIRRLEETWDEVHLRWRVFLHNLHFLGLYMYFWLNCSHFYRLMSHVHGGLLPNLETGRAQRQGIM